MRNLVFALLLVVGCTDSTDISLYVPFALLSTDEQSASSTGVCGFTPLTQAQGFYKSRGLLELDPAINANPEYVLGLQVESYLDQTILADSNGVPISGPQRNDFNVKFAKIHYIDVGGNLSSVSDVTFNTSGTVRPGGQQNAAAVIVQAVDSVVAQNWRDSLKNANLPSEEVILEVQIVGELNSGDKTQTGVFDFPLTVCFDCTGISPTAAPGTANGCASGTAAVPSGHGPCCASQDFVEVCETCGGTGQPCCPDFTTGKLICTPGSGLTCSATPTSTTVELCPYPQQALIVCGKPVAP